MIGAVKTNGMCATGGWARSMAWVAACAWLAARAAVPASSAGAQTPPVRGSQSGFVTSSGTVCDSGGSRRTGVPDTVLGSIGESDAPVGQPACDSTKGEAGAKPSSGPGTRSTTDLVMAATREYARTGVARTVEEGAFETFPYGHAQPTVTCAPLRACVIELEAGETVLSKIAGDTQRWEIQLAPAGADGRTPLVVVKPHDCGLTTNLVLATTAGRIYDLTLDSPSCRRSSLNPHGAYARHVRFYYPDTMVETWVAPAPAPAARVPSAADINTLNFAYRVTHERHAPWVPIAVFDDGAHCYIKLPPDAAHREAPALFALAEDGSKVLLNYNFTGDSYVTDRVFRSAELVVGEGGHERVVRLDNLHYDAPTATDRGAQGGAVSRREP
jgi:P-type conjugative transfer protein TrbG